MARQFRMLIFKRLQMLPMLAIFAAITISGCGSKIDSTQYEAASDETANEDSEQASSGSAKSGEHQSASGNSVAGKNESNKGGSGRTNDAEIAKSNSSTDGPSQNSPPNTTGADGKELEAQNSAFDRSITLSPELQMPEGTTNDLLIFSEKLEKLSIEAISGPVVDEKRLIEVNIARLRVAERLARATQLEFRMMQIKINALALLRGVKYPGADKELDQYAESLIESANPEISDFGNIHLLRNAFATVVESDEDSPKIEKFLSDIERLAKTRPDSIMLYRNVEEGVFNLFRQGKRQTGIRAMKTAIDGFAKSENAEIRGAITQMREHVVVTESKFDLIAYDYAQNPNHVDKLVAGIRMILQQPKIGRVVLSETLAQALKIEQHQDYKDAVEAYKAIKESYSRHENRDTAKFATLAADMGIKRNELVGKKLVLEGSTLSGELLEWSEFRDKVVIAIFWRSSSELSIRTFGQLEQLCDQNEELGIELIGINLDDDPKIILRQLAGRGPDWTLLVTSDINQTGFNSPMAIRCGINEVPYTILIDKSGRVAEVAISGKGVSRAVANLFDREVKDLDGIIKPDEAEKEPTTKSAETLTPESAKKSDGTADKGEAQKSATSATSDKKDNADEQSSDIPGQSPEAAEQHKKGIDATEQ